MAADPVMVFDVRTGEAAALPRSTPVVVLGGDLNLALPLDLQRGPPLPKLPEGVLYVRGEALGGPLRERANHWSHVKGTGVETLGKTFYYLLGVLDGAVPTEPSVTTALRPVVALGPKESPTTVARWLAVIRQAGAFATGELDAEREACQRGGYDRPATVYLLARNEFLTMPATTVGMGWYGGPLPPGAAITLAPLRPIDRLRPTLTGFWNVAWRGQYPTGTPFEGHTFARCASLAVLRGGFVLLGEGAPTAQGLARGVLAWVLRPDETPDRVVAAFARSGASG